MDAILRPVVDRRRQGLLLLALSRAAERARMLEAALSGHALYYHVVGTPQSQDRLIYEHKDHPTWFVTGGLTEDGRYLLVVTSKGSDNNNRLYLADLGDPRKPTSPRRCKPLIETDDAEFAPFGNARADAVSPHRPRCAESQGHRDRHSTAGPAAWKTIVPEGNNAIESVALRRRTYRRRVPRST